jgi:hypothetical protein
MKKIEKFLRRLLLPRLEMERVPNFGHLLGFIANAQRTLLPSYTKYQRKKACTIRKPLDDNSLINQIDISQRFGHGIHSTICGSLGVAPRHPSFT